MTEWTEDYNVNDLGFAVGHIAALNSVKGRKRKHPVGFAAPAKRTRKLSAGRPAGSWPVVPRFDVPPVDG